MAARAPGAVLQAHSERGAGRGAVAEPTLAAAASVGTDPREPPRPVRSGVSAAQGDPGDAPRGRGDGGDGNDGNEERGAAMRQIVATALGSE